MSNSFREQLRQDFGKKMLEFQSALDMSQCLKMDMHCHDKNSDVPDELWGRILGIPETWLKTSQLIKVLKHNGSTAYTITNHNNARSCWKLKEKGVDVLSAAEFTCHMDEHQAAIHVLAYGFSPEQESKLNLYRRNIYKFCSYALEQNIPTVLPHPTYLYFKDKKHSLVVMEKLAILFQRFEVLNGQRDIWQNMLTLSWLEGLREEDLRILEKRHGLRSADFCSEPYQKSFTGGTDDHMGIFAGSCGTLIQVDRLPERMDREPLSDLALEGIRRARMAPYGHLGSVNEKLNTAFLDYFSQVTMNMKDPGLTRIMLHKGDVRSKLFCLGIANGIFELRRHRHTMSFMKLIHEAMRGKKPSRFKKFFVSKKYRPIFDQVVALSESMGKGPEEHIVALREFIDHLYLEFQQMAITGIKKKFSRSHGSFEFFDQDWSSIMNRLELPAHLRMLAGDEGSKGDDFSAPSMGDVFDQCSFPLLGSAFLAASTYTSTRVMFNARGLLDDLSESIQSYQHPKKVLWLTDTLFDKNGVSMFLQELLRVVRAEDLPIDLMTCDVEARTEDHLHVLKETCHFKFSRYGDQNIRIPNLMDVQRVFYEGSYDRIVCSTEVMGVIGMYLKTSFTVPCYFYMHTDWMDFCKRSLHLEDAALSRVRRTLRFYYNRCDGVFVLNEDHRQWLCGPDMGLPEDKVYKTSHWVGDMFDLSDEEETRCFRLPEGTLVTNSDDLKGKPKMRLLYVGRLSEEKGVYDLPEMMKHLSNMGIKAELTIIGDGPSQAVLSQELPSAQFISWLPQVELGQHYRDADLLLFPSRFDTFGCVVLEAMACGCPVLAYNCKGPKDIIEHGIHGYLVDGVEEAVNMIKIHHQKQRQDGMRAASILRAKEYSAPEVMGRLLMDLGITTTQKMRYNDPLVSSSTTPMT